MSSVLWPYLDLLLREDELDVCRAGHVGCKEAQPMATRKPTGGGGQETAEKDGADAVEMSKVRAVRAGAKRGARRGNAGGGGVPAPLYAPRLRRCVDLQREAWWETWHWYSVRTSVDHVSYDGWRWGWGCVWGGNERRFAQPPRQAQNKQAYPIDHPSAQLQHRRQRTHSGC